MTAVAEHLDKTLKSLPAASAASVEKLVWDVIHVIELRSAPDSVTSNHSQTIQDHQAHWRKVDEIFGELDWSVFERPEQGESETREGW